MTNLNLHKLLNVVIASVWIINGLFCKLLNLVPRHAELVQTILNLGKSTALYVTILIGFLEITMAFWILIGYKPKLNVLTQITIVTLMNSLEFIIGPDLLLWGRFNSVFAFLFILIVYFNEFQLTKKDSNVVIS